MWTAWPEAAPSPLRHTGRRAFLSGVTQNLRHAATKGGAVFAVRQAASLVVGLGGTILLTKLLGPAGYGRFAAALSIYTYAFTVAPLGLNSWLMRRHDAHDDATAYATTRSLLLLSSVVVALFVAALTPLLESWLGNAGVRWLTVAMLGALPLQMMNLLPLAVLERGLRYRDVAISEMQGLLLFYGVAVFLAWKGNGPASIVIAWWVQVIWIGLRVHLAAGIGFGFGWSAGIARESLRFGLGLASSVWTWQLRDLVNPLIVGRATGMEGVAVVALAVRLVESASFVKVAVARLSLPALSRLQHDRERLALAVRDGMRVQLLFVGFALLALALLGPLLVPWIFGPQWSAVPALLPLIGAATLTQAAFNLHSAALYALGRSADVWRFHVVYLVILVAASSKLVPLLGVNGYAFAELLAIPAYAAVFLSFKRAVPSAEQGTELAMVLGMVVALVASAFSPWAALVSLLPAALPSVRAAVAASYRSLREALLARAVSA